MSSACHVARCTLHALVAGACSEDPCVRRQRRMRARVPHVSAAAATAHSLPTHSGPSLRARGRSSIRPQMRTPSAREGERRSPPHTAQRSSRRIPGAASLGSRARASARVRQRLRTRRPRAVVTAGPAATDRRRLPCSVATSRGIAVLCCNAPRYFCRSFVSERFYGAAECYGNNEGDSAVTMARIAWADGHARRVLRDG